MLTPTPAQLASLEDAFGVRFPPSYRTLVEQLPEGFEERLPRARFVVSVEQVRQVHEAGLSSSLLPFLVHPEPQHDDLYCFDLATPGPEWGVSVFAVHTTVAQWPSLVAWLETLARQSPAPRT